MKKLYLWMAVALATMLSFSQAQAFQSPSGLNYLPAVYAIDWTYTEPIVTAAATPESVAANTTDNLTILDLISAPYQSYHEGKYFTYHFSSLVYPKVAYNFQRGYITPLRS